jgi:transposase
LASSTGVYRGRRIRRARSDIKPERPVIKLVTRGIASEWCAPSVSRIGVFLSSTPKRLLAYSEPVDMRKSFDGLVSVVQNVLQEDPLSDCLYIFFNRRGNYMKLVTWDRTGYCLFAKKLEQGRFRLPSGETKQEISERTFRLILDGIVLGNRRRMR